MRIIGLIVFTAGWLLAPVGSAPVQENLPGVGTFTYIG